MRVPFTKMQGAGNDFVVLDGIAHDLPLDPARLRRLADRRFGVGADQILVVEPPDRPQADFRYRIFNADGGEVEQCGNGARCFAAFVHRHGLSDKRQISVSTLAGLIRPRLRDDGLVAVDMGVPRFLPEQIPFTALGLAARRAGALDLWPVEVDGQVLDLALVSMGNPHAVLCVADADAAPVATWGPLIERHARFPQRINAGFLQIVDRQHVRLRVWERGSGETLACGTGACAAAVAGIRMGLLDSPVTLAMRGGTLIVAWPGIEGGGEGRASPVELTGDAVEVFQGEIDL